MKKIRNSKIYNYKIIAVIILSIVVCAVFTSCKKHNNNKDLGNEWKIKSSMKLKYAKEFQVDYYKDGYKLLTIGNGSKYLLVPEGKKTPKGIDSKIVVLNQPIDCIYLAATSAMGHFDQLDSLSNIRFSGSNSDDWSIENARIAMNEGKILFAGNYRSPDYEKLVSEKCNLAIESTMIGHSPDVEKKLKEIGIPVFTDYSSYEDEPLGRSEWVKLYGAILNKEEQADKIFDKEISLMDSIKVKKTKKQTVAFFYLATNDQVVVRKSNDYVSKMIELAGGEYIFKNLGKNNAMSSVTIDMEKFYETAKDADILIYNGNITGKINTVDELTEKNNLFKDFKAVKNGKVWATGRDMFQQSGDYPQIIIDMNNVFTNNKISNSELKYLQKLN